MTWSAEPKGHDVPLIANAVVEPVNGLHRLRLGGKKCIGQKSAYNRDSSTSQIG
jgi:hypothetical protein